jgi:hypothetical protein
LIILAVIRQQIDQQYGNNKANIAIYCDGTGSTENASL